MKPQNVVYVNMKSLTPNMTYAIRAGFVKLVKANVPSIVCPARWRWGNWNYTVKSFERWGEYDEIS
jgi:hypothetical protein